MKDPPDLNPDDKTSYCRADVDDVVANLARTQARLSSYLVTHQDDLDPKDPTQLVRLYGQHAPRLDRFLSASHTLATCSRGIVDSIDQFRREKALGSLSAKPEPYRPLLSHDPTADDDLKENEQHDS
jgi:hypothetical protein